MVPLNLFMQAALKRGEDRIAALVAESTRTGLPAVEYETNPATGRREVAIVVYPGEAGPQ